jgi:hypothetical protein
LRIGHDILLPPIAIEQYSRRKGRAPAPLYFVGIIVETLLLEVAELPGIFLQGSIGSNEAVHFRQGYGARGLAGSKRPEQGELDFLLHV